MDRPKVTIGGLLLAVVAIAIGFAAIRVASDSWGGAIWSAAIFAMVASLLGVGFGRGTRRVYWTGFALLGWSYLALNHAPWVETRVGPFLLAPNLFQSLYERLHPPEEEALPAGSPKVIGGQMGLGRRMPMVYVQGGKVFRYPVNREVFLRIGESLEVLLWAALGGWVARYFAAGPLGKGAAGGPASAGGAGPGSTATPSA